MISGYTLTTIIISTITGLAFGCFIAIFFNFPRNMKGLIFSLAMNFVSPIIGVQTYLFANSVSGVMNGLAVAPFLFFIFLAINIIYFVRSQKKAATAN